MIDRLSVCPVRSITVEVDAKEIELIFCNFASVAKECEPLDRLNVSVPDPPSMVSPSPCPALETVIISSPPPALIISFPPLPSIVSSPFPPIMVSAFPLPLRVSFPDKPVKEYAPVSYTHLTLPTNREV